MDEWLMPGIPRTIADEPDMGTVRRIRESITSDTGQVVESDLLLLCPFCSGKPYVQTYELGDACAEARVVCPRCHVSTRREYQSRPRYLAVEPTCRADVPQRQLRPAGLPVLRVRGRGLRGRRSDRVGERRAAGCELLPALRVQGSERR